MAKHKIILDTDPGVDDVLALLCALAHPEIELLAITSVHGNVDSDSTTRNVLSLFSVIAADASLPWMSSIASGASKTVLAMGAAAPLKAELAVDAAYFHGRDGLGGVSEQYPEFVPPEGWRQHFRPSKSQGGSATPADGYELPPGLQASTKPAHELMLEILAREPAGTVTVVAVGPLTNVALALAQDAATFGRCKEVVSMGGAIAVPGNVTPLAEFNFMADPEACALVFSRTSQHPDSTAEPGAPSIRPSRSKGGAGEAHRPIKLTLLPLDTTTQVLLYERDWRRFVPAVSSSTSATSTTPTSAAGAAGVVGGGMRGPGTLARWCEHFIARTFATMRALYTGESVEKFGLSMHDPACVWYLLNRAASPDSPVTETAGTSSGSTGNSGSTGSTGSSRSAGLADGWQIVSGLDVRMECAGRWTRGACVVDGRGRQKIAEGESNLHGGPEPADASSPPPTGQSDESGATTTAAASATTAGEKVQPRPAGEDHDSWLQRGHGNNVAYVSATPGGEAFVRTFLPLIFGEH